MRAQLFRYIMLDILIGIALTRGSSIRLMIGGGQIYPLTLAPLLPLNCPLAPSPYDSSVYCIDCRRMAAHYVQSREICPVESAAAMNKGTYVHTTKVGKGLHNSW